MLNLDENLENAELTGMLINNRCEPSARLTFEMLKAAFEEDRPETLSYFLISLRVDGILGDGPLEDGLLENGRPEDDAGQSRWEAPIGISDLIRLQLNLQSRQLVCHELLAEMIEAYCPHGLEIDMAHSLGYESVIALEDARAAIGDMLRGSEDEFESFFDSEEDGEDAHEDDVELPEDEDEEEVPVEQHVDGESDEEHEAQGEGGAL